MRLRLLLDERDAGAPALHHAGSNPALVIFRDGMVLGGGGCAVGCAAADSAVVEINAPTASPATAIWRRDMGMWDTGDIPLN